MMYYYNDFAPYHMFGFGPIFMILFWILCLWAVVVFFRHGKCAGGHCSEKKPLENKTDKALDLLKERYAKGEITKEEFVSMKKDLE